MLLPWPIYLAAGGIFSYVLFGPASPLSAPSNPAPAPTDPGPTALPPDTFPLPETGPTSTPPLPPGSLNPLLQGGPWYGADTPAPAPTTPPGAPPLVVPPSAYYG